MIAAIFTGIALALTSAGASPGPPAPVEFSADIVSRDAAGSAVGGAKLYAANRKVRIETSEAAAGFFLIDGESGTALFVRSAQRQFMDAKQSSRLTRIFVPVDPRDPCPRWRAAEVNAGVPNAAGDWSCTRVAAAAAGADEYRVVSPDGKSSRRWIDPDLQFPVKLREADGTTIALEHIRVAAQPASLFAVPPDYHRLDPHELIERIKHSDVWVEP